MKQTLRRFAFYFALLAISVTLLQKWPPLPTDAFSAGRWLALIAGWIVLGVLFDVAYRLIRMYVFWEQKQLAVENSPTKAVDVPETNRLDRE